MADTGKQTQKIAQAAADLDRALDAAGAHNPSVWFPIIRFIAPFVARIAIRYTLRKMGRTTSNKNIESAVNAVDGILVRIKDRGIAPLPTGKKK